MPQTVVRHESEHLYARQPAGEAGRRLSAALLRLRTAERAQAEKALRVSGLSNLDLTALRYLVQAHRDGKNLSPKDLIVMLATSSATVTNVIDRLAARGYIVRVDHPTDRRAHHLKPTDEAIQRVDETFAAHHSAIVRAIDELSDEDAQCAADALDRIVDALDGVGPSDRA